MKKLLVAGLLSISFMACKKETTNSCQIAAPTAVAPTSQTDSLRNLLTSRGITATQHAAGFFYVIQASGSGNTPNQCSLVSTRYTGSLLANGAIFDQTTGTQTRSFTVGNLIPAATYGLMMLKAGDKITIYLPPALGYGATQVVDNNGVTVIPPNSYLKFEFELVSIEA